MQGLTLHCTSGQPLSCSGAGAGFNKVAISVWLAYSYAGSGLELPVTSLMVPGIAPKILPTHTSPVQRDSELLSQCTLPV